MLVAAVKLLKISVPGWTGCKILNCTDLLKLHKGACLHCGNYFMCIDQNNTVAKLLQTNCTKSDVTHLLFVTSIHVESSLKDALSGSIFVCHASDIFSL